MIAAALADEAAALSAVAGAGQPQQVALGSLEAELAALVVNGRLHGDDAGRALRLEVRDGQGRVERVAGVDGLQELGCFDEADQRLADHVREEAGAGGGRISTWRPWANKPS